MPRRVRRPRDFCEVPLVEGPVESSRCSRWPGQPEPWTSRCRTARISLRSHSRGTRCRNCFPATFGVGGEQEEWKRSSDRGGLPHLSPCCSPVLCRELCWLVVDECVRRSGKHGDSTKLMFQQDRQRERERESRQVAPRARRESRDGQAPAGLHRAGCPSCGTVRVSQRPEQPLQGPGRVSPAEDTAEQTRAASVRPSVQVTAGGVCEQWGVRHRCVG